MKTKHIEVGCHFICEKIQLGVVNTCCIQFEEQCADFFTKALYGGRVENLCSKLGMINIYAPT